MVLFALRKRGGQFSAAVSACRGHLYRRRNRTEDRIDMKEGFFLRGFTEKGRFVELLSSIPVHVIMNENTALLGAASYAQKFL